MNQLVEFQKQKLINQGTSALGNLLNQTRDPKDTAKTTTPATKEEVKTKTEEVVKIINTVLDILNCQDLKTFTDSSSNGINNTREEILSSCNKAKYLLGMIR